MYDEGYLDRSRLYQRLRNGPHGQLIERFAARLVEARFARSGIWYSLNIVSGLLRWITEHRYRLTDLDEQVVERYLRHRGRRLAIQGNDLPALKRWLAVLREDNIIAPRIASPVISRDRIFREFEAYLWSERGLTTGSIACHRSIIRRFLHDMRVKNAGDLRKISQQDVIRHIESHAPNYSPARGRAMCSSLRAFLHYLHYRGLHPLALAHCVPSIRRWKLATLPTYLSAVQVQRVLDGCDRETAMGRRDYAILLLLSRLGLRGSEVATLTLDDIDWRAGEMLVRAKGRQRARMPLPRDVGAAIVAYLRNGRPESSCRRLFLRALAPNVAFASGAAITVIARTALARVGIEDCAHRHSLATELLRAGATLSEIGQLLGHQAHDTTRIYAKVDIDALRTLSLPWPGGAQ